MSNELLLRIDTESYNEKRWGKPYIAILNEMGQVDQWGKWIGSEGDAGELTICIPSQGPCVIMRGQKDYRGKRGYPSYDLYVDGKIEIKGCTKIRGIKALRKNDNNDNGGDSDSGSDIKKEVKFCYDLSDR